jgi:hypothetical protein
MPTGRRHLRKRPFQVCSASLLNVEVANSLITTTCYLTASLELASSSTAANVEAVASKASTSSVGTSSTYVEEVALDANASTSTVRPTRERRNVRRRHNVTPPTDVQEVLFISPSPSPPPALPVTAAPAIDSAPAVPSTPPQPSQPVNPTFSGSSEIDTSFENPYLSSRTTFTF